jgi:hypothetical protein
MYLPFKDEKNKLHLKYFSASNLNFYQGTTALSSQSKPV